MVDISNSHLDPKCLKIFVAVAETGNMSAVGNQYHISQSGVSQTVRSLEDQMGVELFSRDHRPLALTRQGEILYDQAIKILELQNETFRAVKTVSGYKLSSIHIAMADSCVGTIAPRLIGELGNLANHWRISSGITPNHVQLFLERRVDMVVAIDQILARHKDIDLFGLLREPYVIALPVDYDEKVDIKTLAASLPFIRYGLNSTTGRKIERQLSRMRMVPPRSIEIESVQAQLDIIGAGRGWGLTTPLCFVNARKSNEDVRLEPLSRGKFSRQVNLIARRGEDHVLAVKVARCCRDIFENNCFDSLIGRYGWIESELKFGSLSGPLNP